LATADERMVEWLRDAHAMEPQCKQNAGKHERPGGKLSGADPIIRAQAAERFIFLSLFSAQRRSLPGSLYDWKSRNSECNREIDGARIALFERSIYSRRILAKWKVRLFGVRNSH
jgi:hypothetical protein